MENLNIKARRTTHLKREVKIAGLASILSVFIVLPYLGVNRHWTLSENYLELLKTPFQIFVYLLVAVLILSLHILVQGIFYNIRDISPTNKKSILINRFVYGIPVIASAYYFFSLPNGFNSSIFDRFIEQKEPFYLTLVFILFYLILNLFYFNSKYFKATDLSESI